MVATANPPLVAPPAGTPAVPPPPAFQIGPGPTWQVRGMTCRQLLDASPRDRDAATLFYYGYLAGRTKMDVIDTNRMNADLRRVMDECASNPSQTIPNAFEQKLSTPPRWFWEAR